MNLCSPLIRPPHLDGYDGTSLCDCWYSFYPNAGRLGRMDPENPSYAVGDCPDNENTDFASDETAACYIRKDLRSPYAWPGGYTIVYQLDVFDVSEGWKHAYGSRTTCAACASRAVRNSRLELGALRVENVKAWAHDEGPPIHCDYCDTEMESSYGDQNESEES